MVGDHSDKSPCLLLQKRVGIQGCLNMAKVKNDSTLMDHSIDNKELSMQNDLEIAEANGCSCNLYRSGYFKTTKNPRKNYLPTLNVVG